MCGIAGIFSGNKISADHKNAVDRMVAALIHRGPDGLGDFADDKVAIGMRRLSIIDLEGGWQPLFNEDKTLVLVANGEIYNYIELTDALEAKGHVFSSHSDCETILHLYEDYGNNCIHYLRGMFAFALYDRKNRRALIVRDRMGEKPLYYYEGNGWIVFSSEMKSLLSSGLVPFELDPVSVNNYFHYQYVPEPATPLKDLQKLPAGHYMTVDLNAWVIQKTCYWCMEEVPPIEGDPVSLIREELDRISELTIRSDVPVGVALSGGLDSSAIAALSVRRYPGVMHAFSVGYPGRPANDERNDAKALADHLGMPIHEVELTTAELVQVFEELNFLRDDPIADISGFGYYAVSREARSKGVPVLLQGQGGDELFWGYGWVRDAAMRSERRSTSFKGRLNEHFENDLPGRRLEGAGAYIKWVKSLARRFVDFLRRPASPTYRPVFHELAPDFQLALRDVKQYYTAPFLERLADSSAFDLFTYSEPWQYSDIRIQRLICDTYLAENGIAQGDRLSMANSVELRLPFVDYKLVELVTGLRKTHRKKPDYLEFPKPWLRGAVKGILPDWVINRPKQGFAPPVWEWHTKIFEKYGSYLKDGYLVQAGVLSGEAGALLSTGFFPMGAIAPISFKALVLEIWCRRMRNVLNGDGH